MKHVVFAFLTLLLGGLSVNRAWAQHSSVADVNPREYAADTADISIRTAARNLQNGGAVLVRLHTNKRQLETLETQGRRAEAAKLRISQQSINDSLRVAFRRQFRMAPVFFFPSDQAPEVLAGNFASLEAANPAAPTAPPLRKCVIVDYDDHDNVLIVSSWRNNRIWRPYGPRRGSARGSKLDEAVQRLDKRLVQFGYQLK